MLHQTLPLPPNLPLPPKADRLGRRRKFPLLLFKRRGGVES